MATPSTPIDLSTDGRDPWDRQPGESAKRWGQFTVYRDLGRTRTLKRVAERLNLTHRTAQQYAHTYRWSARAEAFDRHLDEQWIAAIGERTRRMVNDHLKLASLFHDKATRAIEHVTPEDLSPTEVVRLAEAYSKLIRFALGEPDQAIAVTGRAGAAPVAYSHVPATARGLQEELEQAVQLLARRAAQAELDPFDVLEQLPE